MAMTKAEQERLCRANRSRNDAQSAQRAAEAKRNEALAEMDRAVARAANLRWHAVYGAALVATAVNGRYRPTDTEMLEHVRRARAIADQSERAFPATKGGEDGEA